MFKIFLAVAFIATGQLKIYTSSETYDTKEACEAKIPERTAPVEAFFASKNIEVQLKAVCDVDGQPT